MIHHVKLLNQNDLIEKDYLLKYFFCINTDRIVEDMKKSQKQHCPETCANDPFDTFFHTAFNKIYEAADFYDHFTAPGYKTYEAFFDEKEGNSQNFGYSVYNNRYFLKLALRNHCIISGYFTALSDYCKKKHNTFPHLSAKFEDYFSKGYYEQPNFEPKDSATKDPYSKRYLYQTYNNRMKSLEKVGEDSFLWYILSDCSSNTEWLLPAKHNSQCRLKNFKVPPIFKFPIHTFYTENKLVTLSSQLKADSPSRTFSQNYIDLHDLLSEGNRSLDHSLDKFIYKTTTEYYFGFQTILYIDRLLKGIESPETTFDELLQNYRGKIFEDILSKLYLCPAIYSRNFFLKYALISVLNSKHVECRYLTKSPNAITTRYIDKAMSDTNLVTRGLDLIDAYFNTLNNITIPVLSSVWQVVMSKLFPGDCVSSLLEHYYAPYIEKYSLLLTADFIALSEEEIKNCCPSEENWQSVSWSSSSLQKVLGCLENYSKIDFYGSKDKFSSRNTAAVLFHFLSNFRTPASAAARDFDIFSNNFTVNDSPDRKDFRQRQAMIMFDFLSK